MKLLLLFLCIPLHVSLSWTQWVSKALPSWNTASRYLPSIVTCSNSSLILSVSSSMTNDNNSNFNTDISSISQPRRTVICFVNGIHHSVEDCRIVATRLGEIFGDEVRAFYNPSTGVWLSDVSRAGLELFTKPGDLIIAKGLALHLRKALKDVGTQGRVLHMAHSGGAIMTYLAAKHHLTREETDRIDLVTFGGGRSITRKYFGGGRIVNYYSRNDPLLMVDGRAQTLFKLANKLNNHHNHNQNNHHHQNNSVTEASKDGRNNNYTEVRDLKHNTTFIFLNALANQPLVDHSMFGPTYMWAAELEAMEYRKHRKTVPMNAFILRLARKQVARWTGMRHFWDTKPTPFSLPFSFPTIPLPNHGQPEVKQEQMLVVVNDTETRPSPPSVFTTMESLWHEHVYQRLQRGPGLAPGPGQGTESEQGLGPGQGQGIVVGMVKGVEIDSAKEVVGTTIALVPGPGPEPDLGFIGGFARRLGLRLGPQQQREGLGLVEGEGMGGSVSLPSASTLTQGLDQGLGLAQGSGLGSGMHEVASVGAQPIDSSNNNIINSSIGDKNSGGVGRRWWGWDWLPSAGRTRWGWPATPSTGTVAAIDKTETTTSSDVDSVMNTSASITNATISGTINTDINSTAITTSIIIDNDIMLNENDSMIGSGDISSSSSSINGESSPLSSSLHPSSEVSEESKLTMLSSYWSKLTSHIGQGWRKESTLGRSVENASSEGVSSEGVLSEGVSSESAFNTVVNGTEGVLGASAVVDPAKGIDAGGIDADANVAGDTNESISDDSDSKSLLDDDDDDDDDVTNETDVEVSEVMISPSTSIPLTSSLTSTTSTTVSSPSSLSLSSSSLTPSITQRLRHYWHQLLHSFGYAFHATEDMRVRAKTVVHESDNYNNSNNNISNNNSSNRNNNDDNNHSNNNDENNSSVDPLNAHEGMILDINDDNEHRKELSTSGVTAKTEIASETGSTLGIETSYSQSDALTPTIPTPTPIHHPDEHGQYHHHHRHRDRMILLEEEEEEEEIPRPLDREAHID